jgi:hypothetical protein
MRQGDRLPALTGAFVDASGNPIDITGSTVVLRIRPRDSNTVTEYAAAIVTATAGTVQYAWASGQPTADELTEPRTYLYKWEATASGVRRSQPVAGWDILVVHPRGP